MLTVGFAGCADPGPFFDQRMFLSNSMGHYRINAPGYEVAFPDDLANTMQLPTSLRIANQDDALASGTCANESLAGIAVFPAATAAGNGPGTSTLTVPAQGVAMIHVAVEYDVPYNCGGSQQHLRGRTGYTFFPSGRIVRHDRATATDVALSSNLACGCHTGAATEWFFTSYWAFNAPRLVGLDGQPVVGADNPQVCADVGSHVVALAWSPGTTRVAGPGNNASVYDFQVSAGLATGEHEVTSAIQIGYEQSEANCADVHRGLADQPLIVDGMTVETNEDGIYIDPGVHMSQFEISAQAADVPPFAIVLNFGSLQHASVSRSPGSYAVQQTADGKHLFWFDDGLARYDTITIEPY